jgi:hypothetical protein
MWIGAVLVLGLVSPGGFGCAGNSCDAGSSIRPGGGKTDLRGGLPALPPGATWQWQITGQVETDLDVSVYDVDLFDVDASQIGSMVADGKVVICYLSVGSYEEWRPDAGDFPPDVRGRPLEGWEGESWLDIRSPVVRTIMETRLDLAVQKGCDGVEPDNVNAFSNDSGFDLTRDDQLDFNRFLAGAAHDRGLSVGLKNAPELVDDLVGDFDWSLVEECAAYDECDDYRPFIDAGKAVFHVEYVDEECDDASTSVCSDPSRDGFSTLVKEWDLGAWGLSCAS